MKPESEAAFQQQVINLATLYDWSTYHAPDNRPIKTANGKVHKQRVTPGWPDLILVRDGELIAAELKTETGRVRPEQYQWLEILAQVPGIETALWRPSDWDDIQARLSRGRHRIERAA